MHISKTILLRNIKLKMYVVIQKSKGLKNVDDKSNVKKIIKKDCFSKMSFCNNINLLYDS